MWYKKELVKLRNIYLDLQQELDKLEMFRKTLTYYSLKMDREKSRKEQIDETQTLDRMEMERVC